MTYYIELNGAVGEALIPHTFLQSPRTKLIFDVRIDNPFWTEEAAEQVALFDDIDDIARGYLLWYDIDAGNDFI